MRSVFVHGQAVRPTAYMHVDDWLSKLSGPVAGNTPHEVSAPRFGWTCNA